MFGQPFFQFLRRQIEQVAALIWRITVWRGVSGINNGQVHDGITLAGSWMNNGGMASLLDRVAGLSPKGHVRNSPDKGKGRLPCRDAVPKRQALSSNRVSVAATQSPATDSLTTGSVLVVPPPSEMSNDNAIPTVCERGRDHEVVPSILSFPVPPVDSAGIAESLSLLVLAFPCFRPLSVTCPCQISK